MFGVFTVQGMDKRCLEGGKMLTLMKLLSRCIKEKSITNKMVVRVDIFTNSFLKF